MSSKITWRDIYNDFRARHPNLGKDAVGFSPRDFMTILVEFKDGTRMMYDGAQKRAWFVEAA